MIAHTNQLLLWVLMNMIFRMISRKSPTLQRSVGQITRLSKAYRASAPAYLPCRQNGDKSILLTPPPRWRNMRGPFAHALIRQHQLWPAKLLAPYPDNKASSLLRPRERFLKSALASLVYRPLISKEQISKLSLSLNVMLRLPFYPLLPWNSLTHRMATP